MYHIKWGRRLAHQADPDRAGRATRAGYAIGEYRPLARGAEPVPVTVVITVGDYGVTVSPDIGNSPTEARP